MMKLRNKLIIAFCITIFVPILLMLLALFGFWHVQMRQIGRTYGMAEQEYRYFSGSIQLVSRFTGDVCMQLADTIKSEPSKTEDVAWLDETDAVLREKKSGLLVRKGQEIVYCGAVCSGLDLTSLPAYGAAVEAVDAGIYTDGERQTLLKQIDFLFPDGSEGSIFVITILEDMLPEFKHLMADVVAAILLILLLTACLLTVWVYTGLFYPLKKLQIAAQNIKEGNLDFVVETEGDDEIGELCRSFEEMRQRLKDNAEEKLSGESENRMLISNIAHDLKTPITAVKGYAEGLIDGVADTPEKREKYIRTIYNKANEMDTLINELTLYAEIDTNRIPYNFARINVSDYFSDCFEEIGLELESKNIGLSYFNYADKDIRIIADPEQLGRVIHNIINNSIKYLDKPKGFINIRIKDVGDFIQVEIEDNGKGIAARDLPYVFDRFYRADTSRNSATGGSGIGLSIVKKIIEDHGGRIWATGKEGVGTVMIFVIRKYEEVFHEQSVDY